MQIKRFAIALVACTLVAGCGQEEKRKKQEFEVDFPFAAYGVTHSAKPDFAAVEHDHPLSVKDLYRITPELLSLLEQEQIDQIYARLPARSPTAPTRATCSSRAASAASCGCPKSPAAA